MIDLSELKECLSTIKKALDELFTIVGVVLILGAITWGLSLILK